jgi:N-glycosylase/DNA lyase
MSPAARYRELRELRREHASRKQEIRRRLREFASVPAGDYFYELAYCLLTPQSSAVRAGKAVEKLREADFLRSAIEPVDILFSREHYIRFHRTKARRLTEARAQFQEISTVLARGGSAMELRAWCARHVRGLGWKEASHFLRNIGHRDLAILDRHILRNLQRHGVIRAIPASLTPRRYLNIERRFRRFADTAGIPMDELDLLFWCRETGVILK